MVPREAFLSAKSAVTQAQLAADIAHREAGRSEKLLAAGAIADNALEAAKRNDLAAQASLEDAKSRLASAQKNLDNTTIKAPYDGIVSERQVNAGDIVSPGSPLFTLVDPEHDAPRRRGAGGPAGHGAPRCAGEVHDHRLSGKELHGRDQQHLSEC